MFKVIEKFQIVFVVLIIICLQFIINYFLPNDENTMYKQHSELTQHSNFTMKQDRLPITIKIN